MSSLIPSINNSVSSMRMFGDISVGPKNLEKYLQKAAKSRKRDLREAAKKALDDLKKDKLRIKAGLHKGGQGYGKTGDSPDPRTHITVLRHKDGNYHYRFGKNGKLIEIRR